MKKIVKVMVAIIVIMSLPFVVTFVRYKRIGFLMKFFERYCWNNPYHYLPIDIDRVRNGRIRYF